VASPPRRFEDLERILFGDVVVAQSRWTLDQICEGYARERIPEARRPRLELVPPPLGPIDKRPPEALERARRELGISPAAPVFVYPGDLETSGGAEAVAGAVEELVRELPRAIVVFAYRSKSERSEEVARELEQKLDPAHVRVSGRLDDVLALIQTSTAVLFPVEDLWGKVDLPIVLLEAMALGTPVIALDRGPLADLEGSLRVAPGDSTALVRAAVAVERNAALRRHVVDAQLAGIAQRHAAGVVARAYEDLYFATLDARGQHFYESRR
jgi:phosphatidylinositol alpha-1,6-mannosyltransferase